MKQKLLSSDIRTPDKTALLLDDTTTVEILCIVLFVISVVVHISHGFLSPFLFIIQTHRITCVSCDDNACVPCHYQRTAHLDVAEGTMKFSSVLFTMKSDSVDAFLTQ